MSPADFSVVLFVVCVSPWLLAGWFRLPRYTRCFQQVKYRYVRYETRLSRDRAESRYLFVFVAVLGLFGPVACCGFPFIVPVLYGGVWLFVAGIVYLALFLFVVGFAPRGHLTEQEFVATPRTMRLLTTAFFVELIPVWIGSLYFADSYSALANPNNSPEATFALGALTLGFMVIESVAVGPATFILTRFAIPVAALINWPLDALLARFKR